MRSHYFIFTCLLVAASGCAGPSAGPSAVASAGGTANTAVSLIDLTNVERSRAGLAILKENTPLNQAAQIQAEQTAKAGVLGHSLPSATYPNPQDRLSAVGYDWQAWGENLAAGQQSPAAAVDGWMQSSGHRANILSASFTEIGTGYALDAAGRPYYAQVFARPR